LKCCIKGEKFKNNVTGRKSVWNHPNNGVFGPSKARISCQIKLLENNKEMFLFDLHTVGFWALKNARSIADNEPLPFFGYWRFKNSCLLAMRPERLFPGPWPI